MVARVAAALFVAAAAALTSASEVSIAADGTSVVREDLCSPALRKRALAVNISAEEFLLLSQRACGHDGETQPRSPSMPALAYITPWNSGGYEFALRHSSRFTMLSPVWLQLEDAAADSGGDAIELKGQHNLKEKASWLREVKKKTKTGGTAPLVLPRVEWRSRYAPTKRTIKKAVNLVMTLLRKFDERTAGEHQQEQLHRPRLLDGIVLEAPAVPALFPLIEAFGRALHNPPLTTKEAEQGKKEVPRPYTFVLVVPPNVIPESTPAQQRRVPGLKASEITSFLLDADADASSSAGTGTSPSPVVDFLSVMTYDYHSSAAAAAGAGAGAGLGPNAPIDWQKETIRAMMPQRDEGDASPGRLLLGVPFYGYDSKHEAIVGHSFLRLLNETVDDGSGEMKWDKKAKEHYIAEEVGGGEKKMAYFPSPAMIAARVKWARQEQQGLSIWEIGQGLPFFADALA